MGGCAPEPGEGDGSHTHSLLRRAGEARRARRSPAHVAELVAETGDAPVSPGDAVGPVLDRLGNPTAVRLLMWARTRLYGEGVAALLLNRAEIAEVRGVGDARACYTLAAAGDFDAVLLDASLPDASVSIGTLRQVAPDLPIVALGVPESEDAMLRCVEAGASAFATAGQGIDDLVDVLAALVRGEACCSPRMTAALLRQVTALASGRDRSEIDSLTAREFEIGRLVGAGLSNKEIASELHIELATVKNHVHHVLGKLGVERRSRVAPRLLELGLSAPASTMRTSAI